MGAGWEVVAASISVEGREGGCYVDALWVRNVSFQTTRWITNIYSATIMVFYTSSSALHH